MSDFSRDSKSKITLEEILKLKRKERPPAEFWEAFDRDLRRRTLQALVNDEPWYGRYLGSALGRILAAIPLSAAVVATLGFIIYQNSVNLAERLPPPTNTHKPQYASRIVHDEPGLKSSQRLSIAEASRMQVEFVIDVIPIPRDNKLSYEKVMAPQTFTAYSMARGDPARYSMGTASPDVHFVSAPSLEYF